MRPRPRTKAPYNPKRSLASALAPKPVLRPGNPLESPAAYPADGAAEEDFARYARRIWDDQEEALRPLHDVWTQNLLFLSGRQWWEADPTGGWRPKPAAEWRQRPVSNLCMAYFKTFLAKATKTRPAWQVIPASSDPEDMQAADMAEAILESKWLELRLGRSLRRAVAWTIATGNAFLYPYWNTETGRMVPSTTQVEVPEYDLVTGAATGQSTLLNAPADELGSPILLPDGTPDPDAEPAMIDEGDVGIKVYSPFQVRVSPNAECEEDVVWSIVAEVIPVDELRERYPEQAEYIKDDEVGRLGDYDRAISAIAGGADTMLATSADTRDHETPKALVLHYHERPSKAFPGGRYWCSTNDDVLLEPPSDLPDGIWPCLAHLVDVPIPGRYYAMTTLESIIGLNREYNEINAAIKEHHNLMTRGKWVVEKGTGIKKGQITTQPGEVIQVNTGFINGIKQMELRPLPGEVYNERERVLADWEMVSGIHKASMGQAPPGVTAGVAFLQLQEADDTDFGPFLAMLEESVAEVAGAILQIVKARYSDDRLFYVAGPNRRYMVKSFKASELEGAVDVVPVAGSSFTGSKTARQSMLIDMAKNLPGLFVDDMGAFDAAKFSRMLPIGGLESLSLNEDMDVQEALREEEMFETFGVASTELPMVEFWQNHLMHSRQHKKVLKSAKFRQWPLEAQEAFKMHVMEHDANAMAAMMPPTDPNAPPGEEDPASGGPPSPGAPFEAAEAGPEQPSTENFAF